jgi:predicted dehydrogenase
MTHRIGIIGLGTIGQRMLNNAAAHDGFTVAAGWDPDAAAVAEAGAIAPTMRQAASAREVIAGDDVDVVYIGCPPAWHREYVEMAIEAGKPMLCEKPLAVDQADAEAMVAAVEASGLPAAINFVHASAWAVDRMAKALESGELGEPLRADLRVQFTRWPRDWQLRADWLRLREQGGFVREVVSHFVFLSLRLFGTPDLVGAITGYPDDPALCETHSLAQLDCGGLPVTVAASAGGAGPDEVRYTLWGSEKSLRLQDWFGLLESDGGAWTPVDGLPDDPRSAAMASQLDNLAALIEGRPHTMASFADALAVQLLVEDMLADE